MVSFSTSRHSVYLIPGMNRALIREHAVTGTSQEDFDQRAAAYDEPFRKEDAKLNHLNAEKQGQADAETHKFHLSGRPHTG